MKDKHSLYLLIDNTFKYHPPTSETTPKYKKLREAEFDMQGVCSSLLDFHFERHNTFDSINAACKVFAREIVDLCPEGTDIEPLVQQVGVVRNLLNEALNIRKREAEAARADGKSECWAGQWAHELITDAKILLCKTRMRACALIALEKAARDRAQGIRVP